MERKPVKHREEYFLKCHDGNKFIPYIYVILILLTYFVFGAGYYSFPMWLNIIVAAKVKLSRAELSLLGGSVYVAQGACGLLVMGVASLGLPKKVEFVIWSVVSAILAIVAWVVLNIIVVDDSNNGPLHCFGVIAFCTISLGLSLGVVYMVWLGKVLTLINEKWHYLYIAGSMCMFTIGSTVSVSLKLGISDDAWVLMTLVAHVVIFCATLIWSIANYDVLFHPTNGPDTTMKHVDYGPTIKMVVDSLLFRRQLSAEALLKDKCDVNSSQFYWMVLSYMTLVAAATTFMANLGPLLSSEHETSGNIVAQIVVIVWSTVGQTIGRIIIPTLTRLVNNYMDMKHEETRRESQKRYAPVNDGVGVDVAGGLGTVTTGMTKTSKQISVEQSFLRNRTTLVYTLTVGLIFVAALLSLQSLRNVSFLTVSTFISLAYGMMWCVVSSYPSFFPGFDFTFVLSLMHFLGSCSTMVFVLVVSILDLDNSGTVLALLIVSIVAVIIAVLLIVDRVRLEPSQDMLIHFVYNNANHTEREAIITEPVVVAPPVEATDLWRSAKVHPMAQRSADV